MLISIVCPMYNEADCIDFFFKKLCSELNQLKDNYEIICVNDGSTDNTLEELLQAKNNIPSLRILNLSRNFGKEPALTAGIDTAKGDVIIPIDADLQDPPELISRMLEKFNEGYDVVVARRVDRSNDNWLKRTTARMFYSVINQISDVEIPRNVGDFRLISKRVADTLRELRESQRFMKGLFAWSGFRTYYIDYDRPRRTAGSTRFGMFKLINLAWEGITSFSTLPLKVWTYIGTIISSLSFLYGSWIIIRTLLFGVDIPGYASLLVIILFLGGIQLIGIGIIGEYIGRIYMETKKRPIYIVEKEL